MNINRRQALSAGVGAAASSLQAAGSKPSQKAKNILFICNSLGFVSRRFYPTGTGANYTMNYYFGEFEKLRKKMTVFSGLEHPGLLGTLHASEMCFLTAEPNAVTPGFKNTVSIDQLLKRQIGKDCRFPSLNLSLGDESICYTDSGVMIPPIYNDSNLYRTLFLEKTAAEKKAVRRQIRFNMERIAALESEPLKMKKENGIDNFYSSLSALKEGVVRQEKWLNTPPPAVKEKLPFLKTRPDDLMERMENFLTCIRLAFQHNLTRVAVLHFPFYNKVPNIKGIDTSWHRLTHSGKSKDKQLAKIEKMFMDRVAKFLLKMERTPSGNGTLLDDTIVLTGSNLGTASSHSPVNLPIFVTGGGLDHGRHIKAPAAPLNELFLSLVRRIDGVHMPKFKTTKNSLKQFS